MPSQIFQTTLGPQTFKATLQPVVLLGGGGSQTPWLSDIDAAGFELHEVSKIKGKYQNFVIELPDNVPFSSNLFIQHPTAGLLLSVGEYGNTFQKGITVNGDATIGQNTFNATTNVVLFGYGNPPASRVGINWNLAGPDPDPVYALDVVGDINCTGQFRVNGAPISGGGGSQTPWISDIDAASFKLNNLSILTPPAGAPLQIQSGSNNFYYSPWYVNLQANEFGIYDTSDYQIMFQAKGHKVGINTTSPAYPLDVMGDVNIASPSGSAAGMLNLASPVNASNSDVGKITFTNSAAPTATVAQIVGRTSYASNVGEMHLQIWNGGAFEDSVKIVPGYITINPILMSYSPQSFFYGPIHAQGGFDAALPTYATNADAVAAGLAAGRFYSDGAGNVKVVF